MGCQTMELLSYWVTVLVHEKRDGSVYRMVDCGWPDLKSFCKMVVFFHIPFPSKLISLIDSLVYELYLVVVGGHGLWRTHDECRCLNDYINYRARFSLEH